MRRDDFAKFKPYCLFVFNLIATVFHKFVIANITAE